MKYTNFTNLAADAVKGLLEGTVLTKSDSFTLGKEDRAAYLGITLSAASKTVTLGLPDNAVCLVVNEGGTNAFTLKNVSGDSGTSIAAGKAALVRASTTANSTNVYMLN